METLNFMSNEAEQSIIGGLLLNNNAIDRCQDLTHVMFGSQANAVIYKTMAKMIQDGKAADVVTVNNELTAHGNAEMVGGLAYLVEITQSVPSAANIRRYVEIVRHKHLESEIFKAGQRMQEIALSHQGETIEEKQQEIAMLVAGLESNESEGNSVSSAKDAIIDAVMHLDTVMNLPKGELLGFGSGLRPVDNATFGFCRGDLLVVAGRPSMGKSVFAENLMRYNAKKGFSVRYQSYEMKARDLAMRGVSAEGEVNFGNLRSGQMTNSEWDSLSVANGNYSILPITIDEDQLRIAQIVARCRAQKRRDGLDILIVDHLHLMPLDDKDEVRALGNITKALKLLAKELDILVVLVAQLSRSVEQRTDKKPRMSDLRGSGSIEQDADYILFPWRAGYYFDDRNPNEAHILVAKNRNGETYADNGIEVGWQGKSQKFTNTVEPWTPPTPEELQQAQEDDPYGL